MVDGVTNGPSFTTGEGFSAGGGLATGGMPARGIGPCASVPRDGTGSLAGPFAIASGSPPPAQSARGSGVAASSTAIGMNSMLALQAIDEALERDRLARRRGLSMIAALTDLQRALLADEDPALALRSLNELAEGVQGGGEQGNDVQGGDADLVAVLRAVVLRARVEIARRERQ